jgi:RNA-dependent RNA polymerase
MSIDKDNEIPGSIQIRMGGIKGMLTLKWDFPPDKIGIRPSMCKFPSSHRFLEVKRVAKANKNSDNKLFNQILLIMHHQKVPNPVFLDLQRRACAEMALKYDTASCKLLKPPIDFNEVSSYVHKVLRGRKGNNEKFSDSDLNGIVDKMKRAKEKVNLRCSITLLLGVMDEHNILDEGQVLVGNGMIQGPVLICRAPCTTPGDIQRAIAVPGKDEEPFIYLKGSLVFSANGERPLADMLGGGDLDGDEYYVIVSE